jgi:hypothetical protein
MSSDQIFVFVLAGLLAVTIVVSKVSDVVRGRR